MANFVYLWFLPIKAADGPTDEKMPYKTDEKRSTPSSSQQGTEMNSNEG